MILNKLQIIINEDETIRKFLDEKRNEIADDKTIERILKDVKNGKKLTNKKDIEIYKKLKEGGLV
ncbi:MAG: hypothetical protein ACOC56_00875 [Atribacterota bacterium]